MNDPAKPLKYLREQLNDKGDFVTEWKSLSHEDKTQMREWALEEMQVIGRA